MRRTVYNRLHRHARHGLWVVAFMLASASLALASATGRSEAQATRIDILRDLPYAGTDNPRQQLDLYRPRDRSEAALPVLIYLHGGAWWQGDKGAGAAHLPRFVASGDFAGVSVGYRLTDEASWPAQLHDAKAAVRWVKANADRYGLDAQRIAVWGHSAGAHLALMLGLTGDEPTLAGSLGPHDAFGTEVQAVLNFYGIVAIPALAGQPGYGTRDSPDGPEARLLGAPVVEVPALARAASPISWISANDPPVLTFHGTEDAAVPYQQAVRLDRALRKAGVPSYFITVPDAGHGDFPDGVLERTRQFLDKVLLGRDAPFPPAPL
ncbi:alpha/beta hydrolase [Stutzerimonas urumqiensis]|uniref:alpha/beta hydrolase fold domain-containing protein n=1 Tax=Stutzerimonas urumqiensis TaxID=638269 RepID=UPI003BA8CEED